MIKTAFFVVVTLLCTSTCRAEGWAAEVGVTSAYLQYREFSDNNTLFNKEQGFLPGVSFSLGHELAATWTAAVKLGYLADEVRYEGKNSLNVPIHSRTDEQFFDLSFQLGKQLQSAFVYGEAGLRRWWRDIQSVSNASGLYEVYNWNVLSLGVDYQLFQYGRFTMHVAGKGSYHFDGRISVDSHGLYDLISLDLGDKTGWKVALPVNIQLASGVKLNLTPYYEEYAFGRSYTAQLSQAGAPAGTIHEPRSKTQWAGISATIIKKF